MTSKIERMSCSRKKPCSLSSCRYFVAGGRCVLDFAARGGMTQREVANALGISRGLVWQTERRALAKIKKRMRGLVL